MESSEFSSSTLKDYYKVTLEIAAHIYSGFMYFSNIKSLNRKEPIKLV